MKRKTAGRLAKPKECAYCGGQIAEKRPVFLVSTLRGELVGPYHAGCAEKLAIRHKGENLPASAFEAKSYGSILSAREETLRW